MQKLEWRSLSVRGGEEEQSQTLHQPLPGNWARNLNFFLIKAPGISDYHIGLGITELHNFPGLFPL